MDAERAARLKRIADILAPNPPHPLSSDAFNFSASGQDRVQGGHGAGEDWTAPLNGRAHSSDIDQNRHCNSGPFDAGYATSIIAQHFSTGPDRPQLDPHRASPASAGWNGQAGTAHSGGAGHGVEMGLADAALATGGLTMGVRAFIAYIYSHPALWVPLNAGMTVLALILLLGP